MELTTISNVDITKPAEFAELVAHARSLQDALDAFWANVDGQMLDKGITSLKGDAYAISRAERKNWKVNLNDLPDYYKKATADTGKLNLNDLPDYYKKATADTGKLNAAFKAGETVPGADFTVSTYITKKIAKNLVEA